VLKDGYFVPIKDKPLPILREPDSAWYVPPPLASPNLEYVASRFPSNPGHILVNTQVIKPEDYPKSFHEMATDPKYKGKIVWVNPKSTGDVAYKYVLWEYLSKSFPLADIWNTYAHQEPLMLPAPMDGGGAIARGEAGIALSTSQIEGLYQSGAPMKLLFFPDIPYVEGAAGMGVVKDAPHPNAALVFLNWVLSKDGQMAITKTAGYRSMRHDVADGTPPGLKAEVVGGGQRGPTYLLTGPQATLAGDLHTAGVFLNLPEGISEADFENGVENYVKEWEGKNGGPQNTPVKLGG
jgi:ABC-type Fe3+ transport system substrate-binding protein